MVQITPKKKRQHTPKTQPYKKINSYSLSPSKQQIITAILFVSLLCIHEIFITPSIQYIEQAILWTMFGFRYALLLLLIYDYIKLTIKDPVDRLIIEPDNRYKYSPYELRRCSICATTVQCSSHHCMTCNRCTEDFDHHCKYLNNCIGVRNYEYFIRILIVFIVFSLLGILIAAWVLIQNSITSYISQTKKWIIFAYIILSGIMTIVVIALLGFHIYISCCANLTTLQFITAPKQQQKPKLNVIVIQPTPLSAEHFRKTFQNHDANQNKVNFVNVNQNKNQPMEYYRK